MKHLVTILLLSLSYSIFAQEEKNDFDRFNTYLSGGLGFGEVINDNAPNYNLNTNTAHIVFNYKFLPLFGVATGINYSDLSGNGFDSIGNFHHKRTSLKVPLMLTFGGTVYNNFSINLELGAYAQTALNDEYNYLNMNYSDVYTDWNFGGHIGVYFLYQVSDDVSFGVQYVGQSDFTKIEASSSAITPNKQLIDNLNSIGFCTRFNF